MLGLSPSRRSEAKEIVSLSTVFAGLRYIWKKRVMLAVISLDLFAVLLGGAVALLPAIARDRLHVGPTGLGMLRGGPAFGAALMALALTYRPLVRRAGPVLFGAVAVFGLGTIVLGLSRLFVLSLGALVLLGAADMISIFVRKTLVQLGTPDSMRGRVSAVNLVFISASNELGEFESGLTAAWLGVVPAVLAGGVGTLAVVALWWWLFPSLGRVDRLDQVTPESV
jgi:Transmembrane secretion effector